MKKKTVKMVSALVVLAVVCGAYFGVEAYVKKQEEKEKSEEEPTTTNVLTVSGEDIKAIKFIIDMKETSFSKKEDSWVMDDDSEFPVDQDKLEDAVSEIETVDTDRVLENVTDLSEYGLDSPSNTVTISLNDGTETKMRIGDKNDSTGQYYVGKDDEDDTVYLVDSMTVEPFMDTLYDYASKSSFPTIDASDIKKIQVESQENSYIVDSDDNSGLWYVSDENGENCEKADSSIASNLASSVCSFEYDKFIDYNAENLSDYGLDKPYAEITIDYEEEQEEEESSEDTEENQTEVESAQEDGEQTAEIEGEESTDVDSTGADDIDAENTDADDTDTDDIVEDSAIEGNTDDGESEVIMIQKQLHIHVGDQSDTGGRYVTVDDSKEVYTITDDLLSVLLDKSTVDFLDMSVNYLSVNNLQKLNLNYKNEDYQIDVSRETSTTSDEDSEEETETTTTTYKIGDKTLDESDFIIFYNKLINMTAQKRLMEEYSNSNEPEMTITFTDIDGNEKEEKYYSYDTNFYAIIVDEKVYLVNKMTVKEMMEALDTVIGTEEDSETESDSEGGADSKSESDLEVGADSETESDLDVGAGSETESDLEVGTDSETESDSEVGIDSKSEIESDAELETGSEGELENKLENN